MSKIIGLRVIEDEREKRFRAKCVERWGEGDADRPHTDPVFREYRWRYNRSIKPLHVRLRIWWRMTAIPFMLNTKESS